MRAVVYRATLEGTTCDTKNMDDYFKQPALLKPSKVRAAYCTRTAWVMAECARLAYKDLSALIDPLAEGGFTLCRVFNKGGTQAFLARRNDMLVLSFRGTQLDEWEDVRTHLNIPLCHANYGRVASGYHEAYLGVAADIHLALDDYPELPLYITGHSLGGALATIATFDLHTERLAACYTFGSPKVGDDDFDRSLNRVPIYRVVNCTDIIPRLPFAIFGYKHVGDVRYLTWDGKLIRSPSAFALVARRVWSLLWGRGHFFRDHRKTEYARKLARLAVADEDSRAATAAAMPTMATYNLEQHVATPRVLA